MIASLVIAAAPPRFNPLHRGMGIQTLYAGKYTTDVGSLYVSIPCIGAWVFRLQPAVFPMAKP